MRTEILRKAEDIERRNTQTRGYLRKFRFYLQKFRFFSQKLRVYSEKQRVKSHLALYLSRQLRGFFYYENELKWISYKFDYQLHN